MTDYKKPDDYSNNDKNKTESSKEENQEKNKKKHLTLIASNGKLIYDPHASDQDFRPYQCPYPIDNPKDHIRLISDNYGQLIEENIEYVKDFTKYNLLMAELFNAFNADLNTLFGPNNTTTNIDNIPDNLLIIWSNTTANDKSGSNNGSGPDEEDILSAEQIIQLLKLDAKLQKIEQKLSQHNQINKSNLNNNPSVDNPAINKNNNNDDSPVE